MNDKHIAGAVKDSSQITQAELQKFRESFDQKVIEAENRAMRPHASDCLDSWTCTKNPCFNWEPDKIVSDPYVVAKQKADGTFERPERQSNDRKHPHENTTQEERYKLFKKMVDSHEGNNVSWWKKLWRKF